MQKQRARERRPCIFCESADSEVPHFSRTIMNIQWGAHRIPRRARKREREWGALLSPSLGIFWSHEAGRREREREREAANKINNPLVIACGAIPYFIAAISHNLEGNYWEYVIYHSRRRLHSLERVSPAAPARQPG
jgi:hypothetical protein